MDFRNSILSYTDDDKPNPYGKQTYFKVDSDTERELLDISSKKWGISFWNSNVENFEVFETEGQNPMVLINFKAPYFFKGKEYYSFDIPLSIEERQEIIKEIDVLRERDNNNYQFQTGDLVICKGVHDDRDKSFDIYARVLEADRENDVLRLDCFQEYGKYHYGERKVSLNSLESTKMYKAMNQEEKDTFISNTKDDVLDLTKGKDGRK